MTYIPKRGKAAGGLQEAQANIRAEIRPRGDLRPLFEDANKLGKDERDEEVDDSAHDHDQKTQELVSASVRGTIMGPHNVYYAPRPPGARSSWMAKDKA